MPDLKELYWAAGFLEGEGSFSYAETPRIRASQVQRDPLERLDCLLGPGKFYYAPTPVKYPNNSPIWQWQLHGRRAVEWMMTLWVMMSPRRREQIENVLATWKVRPPPGGYIRTNLSSLPKNIYARKWRAQQKAMRSVGAETEKRES